MRRLLEWTAQPDHPPLLATGVPLVQGCLMPDARLRMVAGPDHLSCPIWWDTRSSWPDGSVRWIFLHAYLPDDAGVCYLIQDDTGQPSGRPARELRDDRAAPDDRTIISADAEHLSVSLGHCMFQMDQMIDCSPEPSGPVCKWNVYLVEDSPIAPLYRFTSNTMLPVTTDLLLRSDSSHDAMYLTVRFTNSSDTPVLIRRISSVFHIQPDGRPSAGQAAVVQSALVRSGEASTDGIAGHHSGIPVHEDDLVALAGDYSAVLVRGRRRGPVSLTAFAGSGAAFRLDTGHADEPFYLSGGASVRHDIRLCRGQDKPLAQMILPRGYIAGCGVLGKLPVLDEAGLPAACGLVRGLGHLLQEGLAQANVTPVTGPGILHDGDWLLAPGQYGASGYRASADNEYDTPFIFFQAYAACGRQEYRDLALRCAVHMADVDCRVTDGDMLYHGYGEEADDHQLHRPRQGDLGHYWTDGLWTAYFLGGDLFAHEAALRLTEHVIRHFDTTTPAGEFAICERNIGWPLIIAVSALETGLPITGAAGFARQLIIYLDHYTQDPDRAYLETDGVVWWRAAMQDGSKPFMLGLLGEAVNRYGLLTGDHACQRILSNVASFIMQLYDPVRVDFEYEFNAFGPNHRHIPAQQLFPLFAGTLLDGVWQGSLTPTCERVLAALHASAWCLFDQTTGKEITLMVRGLLPALARLDQIDQAVRQSRMTLVAPSDGQSLSGLTGFTDQSGQGMIRQIMPGVCSDCADIHVSYRPHCLAADGLNRQALLHLCAERPNRSALSMITFYDRIQVRFYGPDGFLIDSLDCFPGKQFFEPGTEHILHLAYQAPGLAILAVDGSEAARIWLSQPLSRSFTYMHVGSKPGNWTVCGEVSVYADFSVKGCQ